MGTAMEKTGGVRFAGPERAGELVPFPQGEALAQALDQVADPDVRMELYGVIEGRKVYDVQVPVENFFVMGEEYFTKIIEDPPPLTKADGFF